MNTKVKKTTVLKSDLTDHDMDLLRGGAGNNTAVPGDFDDQDVDRGTDHCCNTW
ncbi:MAG: hypothetical protein VB074_12390 [Proteiniphilum sp.]|jgi:hypothetical protein|uniref:hypothetical protein n=1 Tax=Proteiniphilum sp. TaxID=1926877 RepID=UPI002B21FADD|nr:hypothetical protein [Proteiniphilum sp.]MEA5062106.1 hypothetical protein [Petrimonas sp.]MEA5128977.1 hypothetical protein [Proteiniphilum sp.]